MAGLTAGMWGLISLPSSSNCDAGNEKWSDTSARGVWGTLAAAAAAGPKSASCSPALHSQRLGCSLAAGTGRWGLWMAARLPDCSAHEPTEPRAAPRLAHIPAAPPAHLCWRQARLTGLLQLPLPAPLLGAQHFASLCASHGASLFGSATGRNGRRRNSEGRASLAHLAWQAGRHSRLRLAISEHCCIAVIALGCIQALRWLIAVHPSWCLREV